MESLLDIYHYDIYGNAKDQRLTETPHKYASRTYFFYLWKAMD